MAERQDRTPFGLIVGSGVLVGHVVRWNGTSLETGENTSVAAGTVTLAMMANLATDTVIGRSTAGTGVPEAITCTASGRALIAGATAAAQRSTLGLGSAAEQPASAFAANAHTHDTSQITTGTMATARLGSGTADSTTFLRGDSTWAAVSGSGTVTSVGLSLPAIFSVSGSPVTTSGTLTGTLATQTANQVWAGPTTGSPAAPAFRALVADDIPALDAAKITTGTLVHERGGLEADVSAYSGLVKITGGTTSAVTITAAGEAILDDADAAAQRTTLGAAAASHTHAASDITSGTLVHERGGLEADVSAYDGLVRITGGATSAAPVTAYGRRLLRATEIVAGSDTNLTATTNANITGMVYALSANEEVLIEGWVEHIGSVTTEGLNLAWTQPAGCETRFTWGGPATTSAGQWKGSVAADTVAAQAGSLSTTIPTLSRFWAHVVNGANTGNWQLRGATETAKSGANVTVKASSRMIVIPTT